MGQPVINVRVIHERCLGIGDPILLSGGLFWRMFGDVLDCFSYSFGVFRGVFFEGF